jgi:hypothetical protein
MDTEALKGLVVLTGIVAMYTFILLGCLEQRLKKVDKVVCLIESDSKYVN